MADNALSRRSRAVGTFDVSSDSGATFFLPCGERSGNLLCKLDYKFCSGKVDRGVDGYTDGDLPSPNAATIDYRETEKPPDDRAVHSMTAGGEEKQSMMPSVCPNPLASEHCHWYRRLIL